MKRTLSRMAALLLGIIAILPLSAQRSLPAPGTGSLGGPGGPGPAGIPMQPARPPFGGGVLGSPWGPGFDFPNNPIWNTPNPPSPVWQQSGTETVMAVGQNAMGLPQRIPITVQYESNGSASYDVTVLNAWSTFTDSWNYGVDQPAYKTAYMLGGNMYNYYVPLSTGTYYFNL